MKKAPFVQNQAWAYGYIEGWKRMRDHVLEGPQGDLRSLDLAKLPSNPQALKHGTSIGLEWMPNTFSDDHAG